MQLICECGLSASLYGNPLEIVTEITNASSEREGTENFPNEAQREGSMTVQPNEVTRDVDESPTITSWPIRHSSNDERN